MTLILPFHYSFHLCAQTNYSEASVQEKIETYLPWAGVISEPIRTYLRGEFSGDYISLPLKHIEIAHRMYPTKCYKFCTRAN
jgi:hypothetical protein